MRKQFRQLGSLLFIFLFIYAVAPAGFLVSGPRVGLVVDRCMAVWRVERTALARHHVCGRGQN